MTAGAPKTEVMEKTYYLKMASGFWVKSWNGEKLVYAKMQRTALAYTDLGAAEALLVTLRRRGYVVGLVTVTVEVQAPQGRPSVRDAVAKLERELVRHVDAVRNRTPDVATVLAQVVDNLRGILRDYPEGSK